MKKDTKSVIYNVNNKKLKSKKCKKLNKNNIKDTSLIKNANSATKSDIKDILINNCEAKACENSVNMAHKKKNSEKMVTSGNESSSSSDSETDTSAKSTKTAIKRPKVKSSPSPSDTDSDNTIKINKKSKFVKFTLSKPQINEIQAATTSNVPTSNQFEALNDNVTEREPLSSPSTSNTTSAAKKAVKPPPITAQGTSFHDLFKMVGKHVQCTYKNMSIGIKILTKDLAEFTKVKEILTKKKVKFFTHDYAADKPLKCILRGLVLHEPDTIKNALKEADIEPLAVFHLPRNGAKGTFRDEKYLVHFDAKKHNFGQVSRYTRLLHQIVNWQKYRKRPNSQTFCRKCQDFGHGTKNCHLDPFCANCGEKHFSSDCTKPAQQEDNLTCFKCKEKGHLPHHKVCKLRQKYIMAKSKAQNIRPKNVNSNMTTSSNPIGNSSPPTFNEWNFPSSLSSPSSSSSSYAHAAKSGTAQHKFQNTQKNVNSAQNYVHQNSTPVARNQNNENFTTSAHASTVLNSAENSNNSQQNEDLFTPEQALAIFKEFLFGFKKCSTKEQQVIFIGDMVFRHCYGPTPKP